jgi:hypothetical protein
MIAKDRPENNIFALAYLILLILGALFGGLVVFGLVIPEVRELGADVGGAAMVIAGLGVMSLLVAAAAAFAAQGMWRGRESGRVATLLLAIIMAFAALVSIPILLLVNISGIALSVPLGTAVVLALASAAVLLVLRRSG